MVRAAFYGILALKIRVLALLEYFGLRALRKVCLMLLEVSNRLRDLGFQALVMKVFRLVQSPTQPLSPFFIDIDRYTPHRDPSGAQGPYGNPYCPCVVPS